ncbi:MAG TPA: hypothetical protein VIB99_06825 [Candidatus Limnocylindrales bacterium]|jgi:hypothetical protein
MARSRTDELLEAWKMVAQNAQRPAEAPRPRTRRSSGPIGLIAAGAVAVVLIVALALRGAGPGPQPSQPAIGASPSVGASPSSVPSPSPVGSAGPGPSASNSASPSASPPSTAFANAAVVVDEYTKDLVDGNYAAAWAMLAPDGPSRAQTFASWSAERAQFFRSVAGRYTVTQPPTGTAPLASWLANPWSSSIDQANAVLVEVDYPALGGNNAGYDVYIVNPTSTGYAIYDVR